MTAGGVEPGFPIGTESYSYSSGTWGDLLTRYKGVSITYDSIGNLIGYYNGASYAFTWTGRQLTGAVRGSDVCWFTYDDAGIRTSKEKNGVVTNYYLSGSTIIAEETNGNVTVYFYDEKGAPIGFKYRDSSYSSGIWDAYYFEKNLQGDIVAVYDEFGTKLVTYTYDAWGDATVSYSNSGASTTATKNPFRYRGYYYDIDLDLYYLNSRYYDANTGRFISPDGFEYLGANGDINSYNLYAYCSNNPVMYVDPSGHLISAIVLGAIIGGVIGALTKYVPDVAEKIDENGFQWNDLIDPIKENGKEYLVAGLEGAVAGAAMGVGLGLGAAAYTAGTVVSASTALTAFTLTTAGSFAAGMGIYALETKVLGLESYDRGEMWQAGMRLGAKGAANFGMGLLMGNQGFYANKNLTGNEFVGNSFMSSILYRTYLKTPILTPFNFVVDGLFEAW